MVGKVGWEDLDPVEEVVAEDLEEETVVGGAQ